MLVFAPLSPTCLRRYNDTVVPVTVRQLMEEECPAAVARAVEALRAHVSALAEQRACHSRARAKHTHLRMAQLVI